MISATTFVFSFFLSLFLSNHTASCFSIINREDFKMNSNMNSSATENNNFPCAHKKFPPFPLHPLISHRYEVEKLVKIHPNVPTSYWSRMMHERAVPWVWLLSCLPVCNIDLRRRRLRSASLVEVMMEGKAGWEGEEWEVQYTSSIRRPRRDCWRACDKLLRSHRG